MSRTHALSFCSLLVLLLTLAGCGPSIDAAAKADIDRRIAGLQAASTTVPAPSADAFAPLPLVPGQWVQYKMTSDKGEPSFLTQKILGEEAGAFWFETVNDSYQGRTVQQMLIAFGNRMDPAQIEIRAVKTKDAKGRVNEVPPAMMGLMQSMYRGAVSSLVIRWQGLPQEGTVVPAGHFDGCFRAHTDAQWGPWKSTADSWSHPTIPISGLVRSQGIDHPFLMELIAYGTSGARSDF
jgi:hypothetical protein